MGRKRCLLATLLGAWSVGGLLACGAHERAHERSETVVAENDAISRRVGELIEQLRGEPPFIVELGTPLVTPTDAMEELAALGSEAIPAITAAIPSESKVVVAQLVFVLGAIGDPSARPVIEDLLAAHEPVQDQDVWDRVIVVQCRDALAKLGEGTGP